MPRNISRWIYRADVGPRTRIVLVEPKNEGNVGAVARAMKNFDAADLMLVNPCPLGIEARQRAMHGADILESATVVPDLATGLKDVDLIVGTSGIDTESEKLHAAFADLLRATDYPVHKVARTKIMFRRMIGRAVPSAWEFHALMGVLQRATKRIRRLEENR